jgi:hypothetical protein
MIKEIENKFCIDQSLRFSTGFSYGASMSYAIACARAKQFRAVAAISGARLSGCDGGRDPIAYYGQHGSSDGTIPIASGKQLRDTFVANNGCTRQTTVDATVGSGPWSKLSIRVVRKTFRLLGFLLMEGILQRRRLGGKRTRLPLTRPGRLLSSSHR